MSCKVTVVTSGKGGVGKTTVTANLGAALAMAGYQTLLIDMDFGLRNLDIVLGLELRVVYTLYDVLQGRCRISQALIRDRRYSNLSLLAAAQSQDCSAVEPEQMKKLIQVLSEDFDYILLDCPAGIGQGFRNAIAPADSAIVVVNLEVSAVRDADHVIALLDAAGIRDKQLVVNRVRKELMRKKQTFQVSDMEDLLGLPILGTLPESDSILFGSNTGNPIVNERGRCAAAYGALCRSFTGQPDLEEKKRRLPMLRFGKQA